MNFKVGDKVRIKNALEDKVFVISEVSQDREGNPMITEMYNWEDEFDVSDLSWYPEELELYEDGPKKKIKETLAFPPFKSYGLTIDQTCEVVENFVKWQRNYLIDMLKEAVDDNNYGMIRGFTKDLTKVNEFSDCFDSLIYRLSNYNK